MISSISSAPMTSLPPQARGEAGSASEERLNAQEQRQVEALRRTDAKVRAHEAAHVAAGSGVVRGGASLQYTQGPDGKRYAVAGEVAIDSGAVPGDPEATIRKAETIRRAALAPADPSAQDRQVAAQAGQMAGNARVEQATAGGQQDSTAQGKAISQYRQTASSLAGETGPEPFHLVA